VQGEYIMENNKLEILKIRYQDQVELLRILTILDLKVIFGYFTVIAAITAWLITRAPSAFSGQIILSSIIGISTACVVYYLYSQKKRRDEAVETVVNLNEAFGLYKEGEFIDNKAINPPSNYRPLFPVYLIAITAVGISSIYLILCP